MRLLVFTTILLLSFGAFAQNPMNALYSKDSDGYHENKYGNGNPESSYTLKNRKLQGTHIFYYSSGNIHTYSEFDNGTFHGFNYSLSKSGDTIYTEHYSHDTMLATKQFDYYRSGALRETKTITYANDSTQNALTPYKIVSGGIVTQLDKKTTNHTRTDCTYYKSGQLKSTETIVNSEVNGEYKEYYPSGQLKELSHYKNGWRNGECILYDSDGKLLSKVVFKDGEPQD